MLNVITKSGTGASACSIAGGFHLSWGFIQLTKRMSQSFQVQTSYTFSPAIDDRPDFTSVMVGADDNKNAQDTLTPNFERGRANADIRHRFVIAGVWDINYGASLQNRAMKALLRG